MAERTTRGRHPITALKKLRKRLADEVVTMRILNRHSNIDLRMAHPLISRKFRELHLAITYLQGRPITTAEAFTYSAPDFDAIERLAHDYARRRRGFDERKFRQDFASWKGGAVIKTRSPGSPYRPSPITEATRNIRTTYKTITGLLADLYKADEITLWWNTPFSAASNAIPHSHAGKTPRALFASGRGQALVDHLEAIKETGRVGI